MPLERVLQDSYDIVDEIKDKILSFCKNLYDQVKFQNDSEVLPYINKKIHLVEQSLERIKKFNPVYATSMDDWLFMQKRKYGID